MSEGVDQVVSELQRGRNSNLPEGGFELTFSQIDGLRTNRFGFASELNEIKIRMKVV